MREVSSGWVSIRVMPAVLSFHGAREPGTAVTLKPDINVRGKPKEGRGGAQKGTGAERADDMRIGELAAAGGVSVRSLRYYEEQGLLTSVRSPSGQRHFKDTDVDRVVFIQRLYAAGLSSRTIKDLLPCVDAPSEATSDAAMERMERDASPPTSTTSPAPGTPWTP